MFSTLLLTMVLGAPCVDYCPAETRPITIAGVDGVETIVKVEGRQPVRRVVKGVRGALRAVIVRGAERRQARRAERPRLLGRLLRCRR